MSFHFEKDSCHETVEKVKAIDTWPHFFEGWMTLDVQRINRSPVDKCQENKPRSPLDSDLSSGLRYPPSEKPGPVCYYYSDSLLLGKLSELTYFLSYNFYMSVI